VAALTERRSAFACAVFAILIIGLPAHARAQSGQLWVSSAGLHLRVAAVGLLDGRVLDRLRDGRSVKVEAVLEVLTRPGGPVAGRATQTCTFSFDLWEERFAVRSAGPAARSISHLRASEAESWCVDQLAVPVAPLGSRDQPFWIRLDLIAEDPVSAPSRARRDEGLSLERLIDVFSQRRRESSARRTIEAGPLRLTP
jgi:hypothetical protein